MLIDASTAFRVADDWDYGFPGEIDPFAEVSKRMINSFLSFFFLTFLVCHSIFPHTIELSKEQRAKLSKSKRISNPGCYPTGFIGLTRPLVDAGIIPEGTPVTVNAISGYSGGGKGLMEIFETDDHEPWGSYGWSLVRYHMLFPILATMYIHIYIMHSSFKIFHALNDQR